MALAPQATEAISLDPISVPSSLKTGDRTLSIFSCGRREMLWADIYNVALYLPPNRNQKTALWNAQVPKAIRVEVVYDGEMPDRLPSDWQRELGKVLSDDSLQALQRTYGDLSNGDVVKVSYLPKRGAAVSVNNRSLDGIDPQPSHALVDALLELWLGDDPVSEQLRHDLASKGC